MEEFKQGFIDEALQLVDKLEAILLQIENNLLSEADAQEIFRIMHTIKGSAAMFGFSNSEKISHRIEDIYDVIREKNLSFNKQILNLTIDSNDLVKNLLCNDDKIDNELQDKFNQILQTVNQIVPDTSSSVQQEDFSIFSDSSISENKNTENYFYIRFQPNEDILQRGIAPVNVFDELTEIGQITGLPFTDNIPSPEQYNPANFFLAWDIFIKTKEELEEVEDCFLFYQDEEYDVIPIKVEQLDSNDKFKRLCINLTKGSATINDLKERLQLITMKQDSSSKESTIVEENKSEHKPKSVTEKRNTTETIKVDSRKLDDLINLVSDLVTLNSRLELQTETIQNQDLDKTVKSISKLSKRFRDNALELRLIPVKVLILKLQRLIRDLSDKLDKEIEFISEGTQTELDKNIIAKLEGPLMHLLRNSIDHGIETKEERIKTGKPTKGIIRFIAFYSGSNVFIQIQDDGGGIDVEKVKKKAIDKGIIDKGEDPSKQDIFNLIFSPGFSTASEVTNVSGRGVGLDVVKKEITDMRGEIDVESELGLGTSFTLKLPLTLSIIDTLLTKIDDTLLLIPREHIVSTNIFRREETDAIIDKLEFENSVVPVISLRKEFQLNSKPPTKQNYVFVKQYDKHYAIIVDKIIGEHQAVVKPLGQYNKDQNYFSGASIMGDGSLAFILDVNKTIMSKKNKNINLK